MSFKASVEIWHTILKYAISVPIFLSSDPIETDGFEMLYRYRYESPYWQSERVRNSLRRVCRTWDMFLKPYDHRFIRLDDVLHERVPSSAIASAVRIDLDWNDACDCDEHCNGSNGANYWENMAQIWCKVASCDQNRPNWRIEIVDSCLLSESGWTVDLKWCAPGLKVMTSQLYDTFSTPEGSMPNLRILLMDIDDSISNMHLKGMYSLTTFRATVDSLDFSLKKADLPSLRHLSIETRNHRTPQQQEVCKFLHDVGPQLETFHWRGSLLPLAVDERLWGILPNAKRIQIPYEWGATEIPRFHPLQWIQIDPSAFCIPHSEKVESTQWISYVESYLPRPSTHNWSVRMNSTWREEFYKIPRAIPYVASYYTKYDVSFVDAHGDTFAQYVVFLIRAFWKRPGKIYRKILNQGENRGLIL